MARWRTDRGGKLSSGLLASAGPSAAEHLRSLLIPCAKTNTAENVKNHRVTQSVRSIYGCRADRDKPAVQNKITFILHTHIKQAARAEWSTHLSLPCGHSLQKQDFVDELGHSHVPLRQAAAVVRRQCNLDLCEHRGVRFTERQSFVFAGSNRAQTRIICCAGSDAASTKHLKPKDGAVKVEDLPPKNVKTEKVDI